MFIAPKSFVLFPSISIYSSHVFLCPLCCVACAISAIATSIVDAVGVVTWHSGFENGSTVLRNFQKTAVIKDLKPQMV